MQERLRIWEVECGLLDAVLSLSFEGRELENALSAAGIELPSCGGCPTPRSVVSAAHRASHQDGPFARRLERLLDLVHWRSLERLEEMGLPAFTAETACSELWAVPDLAGRLWALASHPDPDAADLRRYIHRALELDGLRALRAAAEGHHARSA